MMTEIDYQVIIIGGGIGGLTLASICRQVGLTCRVLERASSVKPAGAAISLAPNALRVLDQIGLYPEIKRVAQPITKIQVSRNETKWNTLDWTICKDVYGYPVYSIERPELIRILYEGAGGPETVELNASVKDIIDDAEEPFVRVLMADGSELKAASVIGADGIRSLTRRVLARKQGNEEANTIKFTGRVHMSGITFPMKNLGPQELGVANWLFYDNSVLMTYGCRDNRQWFVGIKPSAELADKDRSVWIGATPEMIKNVHGEKPHPFAETGKFGDIVDNAERVVAANVFSEVEFPGMACGRIALIGDAAHSMTSFFGQGGCQAIEDAAELANALHGSLASDSISPHGGDVSAALREFGNSRETRAKSVAGFSASYAKLFTANLAYGMGPFMRKIVFSYVPSRAWLWWLSWLYGYQPVIKALQGREGEGKVL